MGDSELNEFVLQGASSKFQSRQSDIFGALDTTSSEKSLRKNDVPVEESEATRTLPKDVEEKSKFKPPQRPVPRRKAQPRFRSREDIRSSGRYTEYTLSDVKTTDLSDSSNTRAALSFLQSRRDAKEDEANTGAEQNPTFHKPEREMNDERLEPIRGRLSKHVMPEYVVGVSKKRPTTAQPCVESTSNPTAKSSHETESLVKVPQQYDWDESDDTPETSVKGSESSAFKKRKTNRRGVRSRQDSDSD